MSSSILSGDFTVYYLSETRRKQIIWTGSSTGTRTMQELYSALQDLFDESAQMDDGVPMSSQTPTQFTIGLIDTGDTDNPWFIDTATTRHLTGGALGTSGFTREQDVNCGIVRITRSGTNIVAADVGNTITNTTTSDSGTLLFVCDDGLHLVIRPTDNTSTHNWDSSTGTITCNGHSDNQTAAAETGECIWANIYTLGTISDNTDIYIVRNGTKMTAWWSTGHIDILVMIMEIGALVDSGVIVIFARQYSQLYDHFETIITSAVRTPIPLATSNDINNSTGYKTFTGSSGTGTFNAGNAIYVGTSWAAATAKGILTAVSGTESAPVLTYYLIGDLTDMSSTVYEYDFVTDSRTTYCTAGTVSDTGIASLTGITYTFGATSQDLNNGNGSRPYNVILNCGGNTLANVYEHTKYVTRRGSTTPIDGEQGEQYLGSGEIYLYLQSNGGFTEGLKVTGGTSGATGWIVANHTYNPYYLTLRDVRGTFSNNETVTDTSTGSATTTATGAVETITLSKPAPFGTFAGGQFFGARGVFISNVHANDGNNYQLLDSTNTLQSPPLSVPIVVDAVESGDRVSVFRADGDTNNVLKTYIASHATANSSSSTSWQATTSIPADTPSTGTIRLVKTTTGVEERIDYTGWTDDTFTLSVAHSGGYTTGDTAYVPYLDEEATGTSVSTSITYAADRYVTVRVRQKGIVPFIIKKQLTSSGMSVSAIRTEDPIFSS